MFKTIKDAYEVAKKLENVELKQMLADIREQSVDLQDQIIEHKNENQKLVEENKRLKESLQRKGNFRKGNGHLWEVKNGQSIDGPFCITCYEKSAQVLSLVPEAHSVYTQCPVCRIKMMHQRSPERFE